MSQEEGKDPDLGKDRKGEEEEEEGEVREEKKEEEEQMEEEGTNNKRRERATMSPQVKNKGSMFEQREQNGNA